MILATVVTLSVAYMQRKQMRQIELHRADSKVPLTPPHHWVTLLVKRNWYFLLFGGFDLAMLIKHLNETTPLTRTEVFSIVLDTVAVFVMAVMAWMTSILRRLIDAVSRTREVLDESETATVRVLEKMSDKIQQLEQRR